jgi:hypothetical protein
MDYQQYPRVQVLPQQNLALFVVRMVVVGNAQGMGIGEHVYGLTKIDAVFSHIRPVLVFVPLESHARVAFGFMGVANRSRGRPLGGVVVQQRGVKGDAGQGEVVEGDV